MIHQQNEVDQQRRQEVEERMNRWYNRLLNRHQDDDPVSLTPSPPSHPSHTHSVTPAPLRWCWHGDSGGTVE